MLRKSVIYSFFFAVGFVVLYNWPILNPNRIANGVLGGIGACIIWFVAEGYLEYRKCLNSGKGGEEL